MKKFKAGETDIADKPRSGRPSTSFTQENSARVDELIRQDRRIIIQEIADAVDVSYGSANSMVDSLGYHKVCAKWVPRQLTPDIRQRRVEVCAELLEQHEAQGQAFFANIFTDNETWAYLYDPESKSQSMEWHHTSSPRPKMFKSARSVQKVMATCFGMMNESFS